MKSNLRILILDNYDSFTYNLVHEIGRICPDAKVDVVLNDKIETEACLNYDCVFLSPGPGIPEEAGQLLNVIKVCAGKIPLLGVCLGHQALAIAHNGSLINLDKVFHGISFPMNCVVNNSVLFHDVPQGFEAGRYHSWVINESDLDESFIITARDNDGNIMAIEDAKRRIFGVQFHPESIMTPNGKQILFNFLSVV
jgi:anthranilate synthase/aminodeoxychorismate synthase-like glutamine amidotransferase